ncbi:MAG: hypothetical protein V7742_21230 [Halioglobus sp.]
MSNSSKESIFEDLAARIRRLLPDLPQKDLGDQSTRFDPTSGEGQFINEVNDLVTKIMGLAQAEGSMGNALALLMQLQTVLRVECGAKPSTLERLGPGSINFKIPVGGFRIATLRSIYLKPMREFAIERLREVLSKKVDDLSASDVTEFETKWNLNLSSGRGSASKMFYDLMETSGISKKTIYRWERGVGVGETKTSTSKKFTLYFSILTNIAPMYVDPENGAVVLTKKNDPSWWGRDIPGLAKERLFETLRKSGELEDPDIRQQYQEAVTGFWSDIQKDFEEEQKVGMEKIKTIYEEAKEKIKAVNEKMEKDIKAIDDAQLSDQANE